MDYQKVLSEKVKRIKPSGIRKYFDMLNEMEDGISLGVGEPDFITPEPIRQAGIDSIKNCQTKYTSNAGLMELRKAIAKYQSDFIGVDYDPETEIIVTVGASEALDLAMRAMLDEGDEVIVVRPCYVCYEPNVIMSGGVVVPVDLTAETEFKLTAAQLKAAITPKTKVLLMGFPNNPTGAVMSKEELAELVPIIKEHNLMVISDEIYAELTYGQEHYSIAKFEGMRERTIVINGWSKSFSMTGWRMGFFCAPKELTEQMYKIHQYVIMCAGTASQYAALYALENGFENDFKFVKEMKAEYDRRRKFLVKSFQDMGLDCHTPQGAFYVFPNIEKLGISSEDFAYQLIIKKKVLVVPGEAFGECGAGFIRCCYATSMERLEKAVQLIKEFVEELRQKN